ncbi:MAG: glycosyltransferase family 4 protein [Coleofasciculus sp. G3-WIS-01]|uniref:glycosyltransferase family 4 protein n=1 Tax=Coleofasciculus sp. G3-WIS-01 TaxID=3069528 RepID=UPI0032F878AB
MPHQRVGFLSSQNYLDRNAFSGTLYSMYRALKARELQIVELGKPHKPSLWHKLLGRLPKNNAPIKFGSQRFILEYTQFAYQVQKQLLKTPCDLIVAPVASEELTFIQTNKPIIYFSDVTFNLYKQYYPLKLNQEEIEWKERQEKIAIAQSTKLVYSSEWAANSAIQDYQADTAKIEIIPLGANLDEIPLVKTVLSPRKHSPCRLLFIGKNWQRKGGDIAFEALVSLLEMGVEAELVVIGTVPPVQHEKLTVIPYLNKNVPQQRQKLNEFFFTSLFFIFPTRADCSPIVICEANAFGLPVLTTDVGGIPTIVKNGKNGYMLSLSASGKDYANLITQILSDQSSYQQLVYDCRKEYDERLNWDKWGERMYQIILDILN